MAAQKRILGIIGGSGVYRAEALEGAERPHNEQVLVRITYRRSASSTPLVPNTLDYVSVHHCQGANTICTAFDRLKFWSPPPGSRYQNWKFHVLPGRIWLGPDPNGGCVRSTG